MSPTDKRKAKYGDDNQAENLILAKEESAEKRKKYKQSYDNSEIKEESKVKENKDTKKIKITLTNENKKTKKNTNDIMKNLIKKY